jgi:hypothetical protein
MAQKGQTVVRLVQTVLFSLQNCTIQSDGVMMFFSPQATRDNVLRRGFLSEIWQVGACWDFSHALQGKFFILPAQPLY